MTNRPKGGREVPSSSAEAPAFAISAKMVAPAGPPTAMQPKAKVVVPENFYEAADATDVPMIPEAGPVQSEEFNSVPGSTTLLKKEVHDEADGCVPKQVISYTVMDASGSAPKGACKDAPSTVASIPANEA